MNSIFNSPTGDNTGRKKIALIQACWHKDIVDEFCRSFLTAFNELDGRPVECFELPGAFEIPLKAKTLASSGEYAGIVATGLIVDGGIYRHDFVSTAVIDGLMRTQLDTGVPIFSGVLTPHDFLGEGQPEFFKQHFVVKGSEAAHACAQTLASYQEIQLA